MEQSPFWEANRRSSDQQIPRRLYVDYRAHNSPGPYPMNQVHIPKILWHDAWKPEY
jgi:hypothetical protein